MSRFFVVPPSHPPRGFHIVTESEIAAEPAETGAPAPIDWTGLEQAGAAAVAWLLATLRARTADPDDLGAIDRVERAVGEGRTPDEVDALAVAGLAISVFETTLGIPGLSAVAGQIFDAVNNAPPVAQSPIRDRDGDRRRAYERARPMLVCVPRGPRLAHGITSPRPAVVQLVVR